jgi:hypothetical protein
MRIRKRICYILKPRSSLSLVMNAIKNVCLMTINPETPAYFTKNRRKKGSRISLGHHFVNG